MVQKTRVVRLLQDLIRINSENPPGNEIAIAAFVQRYLSAMGLRPRIHEFKKGRPNVLATVPGGMHKHSLLITPHLDTVPAGSGWTRKPFAAQISAGRMYGLGATDCKVNIACALEAMQSLRESRCALGYDLIFAATANEESGSDFGLIDLLDRGVLKPHAAVVLDADEFDIVVTQKGLMHLKVTVRGRKAHGAYPWRGLNAIAVAVDILADLKRMKFAYRKNEYLRPPTMNIGTIRGGDKVNVVADACEFELDFRFLPGMSAKALLAAIKKKIRAYSRKWDIEIEGIQKPYAIGKEHPLVASLVAAMKRCGIAPRIKGSEGATVITFFQDKSIPAIATGFGCEGCYHAADEYVTVDHIYKGAVVLEQFLKAYKAP